MTEAELKIRTKQFAHRCVKLAISLPETTLGRHIKGQLIRAATSVAANYRAACLSQSKRTFVAKLSIVIEEADESYFWIEFVVNEQLITAVKCKDLLQEAHELASIFIVSRKTANRSLEK